MTGVLSECRITWSKKIRIKVIWVCQYMPLNHEKNPRINQMLIIYSAITGVSRKKLPDYSNDLGGKTDGRNNF